MLRAGIVCFLIVTAADADAELKALAGTWVIEDALLAGRDHKDDFEGMKLVVDGKTFAVHFGDNSDRGTITIDAAKDPKWIDLTTAEKGPFKGRKLPGIYKIVGDTLTVCCNTEKADRPAKFEAPAKTPLMLLTFKRETK